VNQLVHLELHTSDEPGASAFYAGLLGWRAERVRAGSACYLTMRPGGDIGAGIVECATERAVWLPYVNVPRIEAATERAMALGATVLLGPREASGGWRTVLGTPAGGELALWQAKSSRWHR
jgi:predicted enzyme related to lactoylglutathione lyase